jgi:hypothetical protein
MEPTMGHLKLQPAIYLLLAAWAVAAGAETVYKSIDAQGHVTYSSTPPEKTGTVEKVEEVPIVPGPTEEERRKAEQRAQETETAAGRLGAQQQQRQTATSQVVAEAEKNLEQARTNLEQAKVKNLDDWQYLASGGRVLKQSYFDRVATAEQQVREAERALQDARSSQR